MLLYEYSQKQPPDMFHKKGVFKNFEKFTEKHFCQNPFCNRSKFSTLQLHSKRDSVRGIFLGN